MLTQGHVELRSGRGRRRDLSDVTHHAHDRHPLLGGIETAHDAMPDRIVGPEALPRQRFADDGHERPLITIAIIELPHPQDGNGHGTEVPRARQAKAGRGQPAEVALEGLLALDRVRAVRVVGTRRQSHRSSGRDHARDLAQPREDILEELAHAEVVVEAALVEDRAARGRIRVRNQDALLPEAQGRVRERGERPEEQTRVDGQHERQRHLSDQEPVAGA